MDSPTPPDHVCSSCLDVDTLREDMNFEIQYLHRELAKCRQALQALQQANVCPTTAVLVLEESTEVPLFVNAVKYLVDLSKCHKLRSELAASNVRRFFLIVPFTTDPAQQSTWQTVINECIPTNAVAVTVCPAPRQLLSDRQIIAFGDLLAGLDKASGGLQTVVPLESESVRPKPLLGLDDNGLTEESAHWLAAKKMMEGEGLHWPAMLFESVKQKRQRLQIPSRDIESVTFEKCMRRYKRLDLRFEVLESFLGKTNRSYYKRWPFDKVKRHVEHFSAQQLDEFWHRMDRWEAWVRHDESIHIPLLPLIESVYKFSKKCTSWIRVKIRKYVTSV